MPQIWENNTNGASEVLAEVQVKNNPHLAVVDMGRVRGGFNEVANLSELHEIPADLLKDGVSQAFVVDENEFYVYRGGAWEIFKWLTRAKADTLYAVIDHTHQLSALDGLLPFTRLSGVPTEVSSIAHTHSISEVISLQAELDGKSPVNHSHDWVDITGKPTNFSYIGHTHSMSSIIGLGAVLDTKSPIGHTHNWAELAGVPAEFTPEAHVHDIAEVTGLQAELNDKSEVGHTHNWIDIEGKPLLFNPSAHTHLISEVTGLQAAIDGRAALSHVHAISEVTGLQAELDNKADLSHTHQIGDIAGLTAILNDKAALNHTHDNFWVRGISTGVSGDQAIGFDGVGDFNIYTGGEIKASFKSNGSFGVGTAVPFAIGHFHANVESGYAEIARFSNISAVNRLSIEVDSLTSNVRLRNSGTLLVNDNWQFNDTAHFAVNATTVDATVNNQIPNWGQVKAYADSAGGGGGGGGGITQETDPIFVAHDAYNVTAGLMDNWNSVYADFQNQIPSMTNNYLAMWNGTKMVNSPLYIDSYGKLTLGVSNYGGGKFNVAANGEYDSISIFGMGQYSTYNSGYVMTMGTQSSASGGNSWIQASYPYVALAKNLFIQPLGGFTGFGKQNPSETVDIAGNLRYDGNLKPDGTVGTDGKALFNRAGIDMWDNVGVGDIVGLYDALAIKLNVSSLMGTENYFQMMDGGGNLVDTPMYQNGSVTYLDGGFQINSLIASENFKINNTIEGIYASHTENFTWRIAKAGQDGHFAFTMGGSASNAFAVFKHGLKLQPNGAVTFASELLDVDGNIRYDGSLKPNGTAGVDGKVLFNRAGVDQWDLIQISDVYNLSDTLDNLDIEVIKHFTETNAYGGQRDLYGLYMNEEGEDSFFVGMDSTTSRAMFRLTTYDAETGEAFSKYENYISPNDGRMNMYDGIANRKYAFVDEINTGGQTPGLQSVAQAGRNADLRLQYNGTNYATVEDLTLQQVFWTGIVQNELYPLSNHAVVRVPDKATTGIFYSTMTTAGQVYPKVGSFIGHKAGNEAGDLIYPDYLIMHVWNTQNKGGISIQRESGNVIIGDSIEFEDMTAEHLTGQAELARLRYKLWVQGDTSISGILRVDQSLYATKENFDQYLGADNYTDYVVINGQKFNLKLGGAYNPSNSDKYVFSYDAGNDAFILAPM